MQDNGGTANGGVDLETAANAHTLTVNVTSVNDAPAGTDKTVTTANEDRPTRSRSSDFGFSDTERHAGQHASQGVRITSAAGTGTLALTGCR